MEVIFFEGEAQNSKLVGSKGMPNCTPRHDGRVKDMTLSSRKNIKESKMGKNARLNKYIKFLLLCIQRIHKLSAA